MLNKTTTKQNMHMKSFTTFVFLIVLTTQLVSQEVTKEGLLGNWKVVDSQLMPEMEMGLDAKGKKKMEQMRIGFIGTVLYFEVNNKFRIKYPDNIPKFIKELEFLNNKQWMIKKGQRIAIGTAQDGYSLMGIIVSEKHGKKYFILDESPFILEVTKQIE
jgi:hypothetical protein